MRKKQQQEEQQQQQQQTCEIELLRIDEKRRETSMKKKSFVCSK